MNETTGQLNHQGDQIAWRRVDGRGPTVVWLGGFRSDMAGTKAQALADWAAAIGRGTESINDIATDPELLPQIKTFWWLAGWGAVLFLVLSIGIGVGTFYWFQHFGLEKVKSRQIRGQNTLEVNALVAEIKRFNVAKMARENPAAASP